MIMILTVSFHFREPFIPNIILLISLILFLLGSIFVRKDSNLKRAYLLIIGGTLAVLWYIIDFFIPGILLPSTPTPEDIEFTRIYGSIFTGWIPNIVLILSLGIMPLVIFLTNRTSNSIKILALGAIIQIIAIVVCFDPYNIFQSTLLLILTGISMACFAFYGYKIKNFLLILFAGTFFVGRLLYFIMI